VPGASTSASIACKWQSSKFGFGDGVNVGTPMFFRQIDFESGRNLEESEKPFSVISRITFGESRE
jgi:hypothetical protein